MIEALSNHENSTICWNTVKLFLPKCKKEKDMNEQSAISREDQELFWSKLAYFFGAWLGDGWYSWNPYNRVYSVGIKCMDHEIISKCFLDVSMCITDLKPHRYQETTEKGTVLDKLIWYNQKFTGFVVMATAAKTKIPDFIWEADKQTKLNFLAGLMDTDGTILKQANKDCRDGFFYRLSFSGTKGFVTQFPDLLRILRIKTIGKQVEEHINPNHARRLIVSISLPSAIQAGFKFYCRRKQDRLDDAIERSKTRYVTMTNTRFGSKVPSETIRRTTDIVEDIVQHCEKL